MHVNGFVHADNGRREDRDYEWYSLIENDISHGMGRTCHRKERRCHVQVCNPGMVSDVRLYQKFWGTFIYLRKKKRAKRKTRNMKPIRRMGNGYEPHVEQFGDRLTYSLPVDSGVVSFGFTFELRQADLDVLLSDDYRRAVLEVIAHTLLQHSTIRGNARFTQSDFDSLVSGILHSTNDDLHAFIAQVGRDNKILIDHYVKEVMKRRSAENLVCRNQ